MWVELHRDTLELMTSPANTFHTFPEGLKYVRWSLLLVID